MPGHRVTNLSRVWTENDWNSMTWEDGIHGDLATAYRVSKKFAEKAAWEFMETEKPQFDLITLAPPGVFGFPSIRVSKMLIKVHLSAGLLR